MFKQNVMVHSRKILRIKTTLLNVWQAIKFANVYCTPVII